MGERGLQEDEGMVLENVLVVVWRTKSRTMKTLCPHFEPASKRYFEL
jgi:hypothetical protein